MLKCTKCGCRINLFINKGYDIKGNLLCGGCWNELGKNEKEVMMSIKTKEEYNKNRKELANRHNSLKTKNVGGKKVKGIKAGGEIESDNPENDELIAQIDDFFVYNLNNSYLHEEHEKEIELKLYMRIDKIENTADFILINAFRLWRLQHNLNSINYTVPFIYKDKGKSCMGVDLGLEVFLSKLKSGKIKITKNVYNDLEGNYNIIRIVHTIKDRIKEENLPIILKLVQYREDRIGSKRFTKNVRMMVMLPSTNYDIITEQYLKVKTDIITATLELKLEQGKPITRWFWQKPPKVAEKIKMS